MKNCNHKSKKHGNCFKTVSWTGKPEVYTDALVQCAKCGDEKNVVIRVEWKNR